MLPEIAELLEIADSLAALAFAQSVGVDFVAQATPAAADPDYDILEDAQRTDHGAVDASEKPGD